jgi:hypothetical protein
MSERIKHLAVNWVDGMKISKSEFMQTENFLLDQIRDGNSLQLNDFNFGLLSSNEPGMDALSLDINSERIEVYQCRAVTRSGTRIEVIDMDIPSLRQPIQQLTGGYDFSRTTDWYVLIKTDPFVRQPYGQPASGSNPLRHLHSIQQYGLEIVESDQIQNSRFAAFCVPVAKIKSGYSGIEQVRNYIPPFTRMSASLELSKIHKRSEDDLFKLEQYAINLVKKLIRKREGEPSNILAQDLYLLAWNLVDFVTANIDYYRLTVPSMPPVYHLEFFMRLARTVRTSTKLMKGKDGLMNYLQNFLGDFSPATYESSYEGVCSLIYSHFEIRSATDKVDNFLGFLKNLLLKLEELDYEKLVKFDPILRQTRERMGRSQEQMIPNKPDSGDRNKFDIRPRGEPPVSGGNPTEDDWLK